MCFIITKTLFLHVYWVLYFAHCVDTREILSAEDQWKRYIRIVVSASFHIQRKTREDPDIKQLYEITYLYPLTALYSSPSHPLSYSSFTSLPDAPTCISPVAERPQHMLMRVAVGIHKEDIDAAIEVCIPPYLVWFTSYFLPWILTCATPFCILIHPSTYTLKPTHSFTYSHTKST